MKNKTVGYRITKKDILTATKFLKSQNKPSTLADAKRYLQEKLKVAHMLAHKIVADEKK